MIPQRRCVPRRNVLLPLQSARKKVIFCILIDAMASFISALPAPRHTAIDEDDDEDFFAMQAARGGAPPPPRKKIPAYGARAGFIPRSNEDFGEGGAYPEVHVAQYPLNMGR